VRAYFSVSVSVRKASLPGAKDTGWKPSDIARRAGQQCSIGFQPVSGRAARYPRNPPARITPYPTGRLFGVALTQALRARLRSACPSGIKAIRPLKTRMKLAFMPLRPGAWQRRGGRREKKNKTQARRLLPLPRRHASLRSFGCRGVLPSRNVQTAEPLRGNKSSQTAHNLVRFTTGRHTPPQRRPLPTDTDTSSPLEAHANCNN
jgi:hypothetical protein